MLEKIFAPAKDYSVPILSLGIAAVFVGHGYLKLSGLPGFESFLEQAGTPFPGIMAPIVAGIEFLGGLAILLGISTRLSSLLLRGS